MRPFRQRFLRAALITFISAAVFITLALFILSGVVEKKARARLEAAGAVVGALDINLFTRSILIRDLEFSRGKNTFFLEYVRAGGIKIIPFMRERGISIKRINIENGTIKVTIDSTEQEAPDSIAIKSIDIDRLEAKGLKLTVLNDSVPKYQAEVGFVLSHITLDNPKDFKNISAYRLKNIECLVRDLKIQTDDRLYEFRIKEATFDKETMRLRIDSLALQPLLSKSDFAKKVKSQQTRTTIVIGRVDADGVNMAVHMQDTAIMVSSLSIVGLNIHAYKDKRYPFTRKEKFPLPMESFRSLHFGFEVDTIKIENSQVTYEEFPSQGFHTGQITFDDVEATMSAVNNREFKNLTGYSTLKATATLMKTGKIDATFKLPLDQTKKYTAEGNITNVPLAELNPILKDVAFVEIESGRLNRMDFAFTYDDVESNGRLDFAYENLRILTLKKEKSRDVAAFKTMLVNTAVKNDQVLTGEISVQRNQRKAVFNLWTISIVDGIKSAMMPTRRNKSE